MADASKNYSQFYFKYKCYVLKIKKDKYLKILFDIVSRNNTKLLANARKKKVKNVIKKTMNNTVIPYFPTITWRSLLQSPWDY